MKSMAAPNFFGTRASCDGAEFTLSESIYPAGLKMPSHEHEPAYFSVLLKGAYTETCRKGTRTCNPWTMVFHPPHERHAVEFHNAEVRIFRVEIKSRWFERTRKSSGMPEYSTDFNDGLVSSLGMRLYGEFQRNDVCSPLAIEGLMLEIIAEVSRRQIKKSNQATPLWLKQAREILHENITEPPSLEKLAQAVGVHPVSLAREFRRSYHCTVGEYLRQLRIETACRELSCLEEPLSVIATNAGFYDQSHFANTFRRYTGMTPTQYRSIGRLAQR